MITKEEVLKQVEEFKNLEQKKLKLDVNSLRKYLNLKKTLHQKFDLDKLRKLRDKELVIYIESVLKGQESGLVEQVKEETEIQEVRSAYQNEIRRTVETGSIYQRENDQVEEEIEEQELIIHETDEEEMVEEDMNEKFIEKRNRIKGKRSEIIPQTANTSELHDILQENTEEIAEEVKRIRKIVQENIVEIDVGRNFSVQFISGKIKIVLPKSAEIKIAHSLLLELYNKAFGLENEEVKEIETTSEENELKLKEQSDIEIQEEMIEVETEEEKEVDSEEINEKLSEDNIECIYEEDIVESIVEENIEDNVENINKENNVETVYEENSVENIHENNVKEEIKKQLKKKRTNKKCITIPKYPNYVDEWKPKNAPRELLDIYNSEKQNYAGKSVEEIAAIILNLDYENDQLCKTDQFNRESVTLEQIYRLRIFGGMRFNSLVEIFRKLLDLDRDEATEFLNAKLRDVSDEILDNLFGKTRRNKIKGQE